ncbi:MULTISPECIES: hypothetical protein [Bacillus cereus group]|uniref:hypothetical protein n=1 Tax=Bacillus cereus group TaxID=86661 RepID=UPI001593617F|nr:MULTISPECIES: hypothetical protein [Bacillus cereus group]MBJ8083252.1 hypothetical protein [Bacillus cereus group sp. N14]
MTEEKYAAKEASDKHNAPTINVFFNIKSLVKLNIFTDSINFRYFVQKLSLNIITYPI